MEVVTDLPCDYDLHDDVLIEMEDGALLAARLWLPRIAQQQPVPAVFEYVPYRRRDGTADRDAVNHGYFAGHGYACLRVDMRGSGDSQGILEDEYTQQELDDGVAILAWLGRQPWCNGRVGMIGISWGGFNGLQIAAMQPPELHAVITASSTDDRYADDVHHMGGCLLGDNLSWASVMFAINSLPPDPESVGERWREMWMDRLEQCRPWLVTWLEHQRRDDYWRHGSICEDFAAVRCPVFAVSGWADGYSNSVFRLMAGLSVPRRGLVGPWSHLYPHQGQPGPAIGFLQECLRWWDRWLQGRRNGVDDEPMVRAWLQHSVPPTTRYEHRPGAWIAEDRWPSPNIEIREFHLAPGELHRTGGPQEQAQRHPQAEVQAQPPQSGGVQVVQSPLTLGLYAGKWCSYATGPDLAHDQREEDGGALVFETETLAEPLELFGQPEVVLRVCSNRPQAQVAARLSDVAPDGKATRISYGLLNLAQRDGPGDPQPLRPGEPCDVSVALNYLAQHLPAGHRLRLSISTSYWPIAWPPPEPVRLQLVLDGCHLRLPQRPGDTTREHLPNPFGPPEGASPLPRTRLQPNQHDWRVIRDLDTDVATLEVVDDRGLHRLDDIGLTTGMRGREWYSTQGDDFNSARGETRWTCRLERGDWRVQTESCTVLTSDAENFYVQADLDAYEGGQRVFCRTFEATIPRDNV